MKTNSRNKPFLIYKKKKIYFEKQNTEIKLILNIIVLF